MLVLLFSNTISPSIPLPIELARTSFKLDSSTSDTMPSALGKKSSDARALKLVLEIVSASEPDEDGHED